MTGVSSGASPSRPELGAGQGLEPDRLPGRARRDVWGRVDLALVLLSLAAVLLRAIDATGSATAVVCLVTALLVPGAAIAHLLGLREPLAWLAVDVSASLAVTVLVSMLLLRTGAWRPDLVALLVLAVSAGALVTHSLGYWGTRHSATPARS
jgi:hypothetical protein